MAGLNPADFPDALKEVAKELRDIRQLLDGFEATQNAALMKQAAAKIKANAPVMKQLGEDESFKTDAAKREGLKVCRNEMRELFDRAKKLKADEGAPAPAAAAPAAKEPEPAAPNRTSSTNVRGSAGAAPAAPTGDNRQAKEDGRRERQKELEDQLRAEQEQARQRANEKSIEDIERVITSSSTTKPVFKRTTDLWSQILNERDAKGPDCQNNSEQVTLVAVGDKNCGKSTMLYRYLEKGDIIEPTTALEYAFGRRQKKFSNTGARDVIHSWELAGGQRQTMLLEAALTPSVAHAAVALICVDLSRPSLVLDTVTSWIETLRRRVEDCLKDLRNRQDPLAEVLRKKSESVFPADHPDKPNVRPIGIPVVIVGMKYDVYEDLDISSRRVISRAIRFLAHLNGCSVVFISKEEEALMARFRNIVNYHLFDDTRIKAPTTDHTKPLLIPAGTDSFDQIGQPSGASGAVSTTVGLRVWRESMTEYFPKKPEDRDDDEVGVLDDSKFQEPVVDAARIEKEKELEKYKRDAGARAAASRATYVNNAKSGGTTEAYERAAARQQGKA